MNSEEIEAQANRLPFFGKFKKILTKSTNFQVSSLDLGYSSRYLAFLTKPRSWRLNQVSVKEVMVSISLFFRQACK